MQLQAEHRGLLLVGRERGAGAGHTRRCSGLGALLAQQRVRHERVGAQLLLRLHQQHLHDGRFKQRHRDNRQETTSTSEFRVPTSDSPWRRLGPRGITTHKGLQLTSDFRLPTSDFRAVKPHSPPRKSSGEKLRQIPHHGRPRGSASASARASTSEIRESRSRVDPSRRRTRWRSEEHFVNVREPLGFRLPGSDIPEIHHPTGQRRGTSQTPIRTPIRRVSASARSRFASRSERGSRDPVGRRRRAEGSTSHLRAS